MDKEIEEVSRIKSWPPLCCIINGKNRCYFCGYKYCEECWDKSPSLHFCEEGKYVSCRLRLHPNSWKWIKE